MYSLTLFNFFAVVILVLKDAFFAKLLEPCCILDGLNCRKICLIFPKYGSLDEAFAFLRHIPLLEKVNQGEMVGAVAIDKAVFA